MEENQKSKINPELDSGQNRRSKCKNLVLFFVFVLILTVSIAIGFLYFWKKTPRIPEIPGKIIPSETLIQDGNSGE